MKNEFTSEELELINKGLAAVKQNLPKDMFAEITLAEHHQPMFQHFEEMSRRLSIINGLRAKLSLPVPELTPDEFIMSSNLPEEIKMNMVGK